MMKAYSYSRFSSRAQAEGDSLRRQLSAAYDYAEANGLELDMSLRDLGVSAFTGDNRTKGALRSFLVRVENGEIERGSYLLIDSMDRLSRQMVTEATHQLLGIALAGITVVTLSDGRKFDRNASMADVMMAVIEIERSHRESAEKGRKVAEAHAESKRLAREEGRVWHKSGPTWTVFNETTKKFDEIPHKAAIVRRIYDMVESGLGTTSIALKFNEEGVETPRGKNGAWHHSAVLEIAKSKATIGVYQPKLAKGGVRATRRPPDGEPVENYYPVVIQPDQFYRVQAIIEARSPKRTRGNNSKDFANLLVGLCKCHVCGGTVGMHTASKDVRWKRNSVLQCVDARRGLCTHKHRYRYKPLEDAILKYVVEFMPPSERTGNDIGPRIGQAEAERADLQARVDNLLDQMEEGDPNVAARLKSRSAQLAAKDAEIADLREASKKRGVSSISVKGRQEVIQRLLGKMDAVEGEELYRLRATVSAALKGVIAWIEFVVEEVCIFHGPQAGEPFLTHYVMVHMADEETTYIVDPYEVIRWGTDEESSGVYWRAPGISDINGPVVEFG